jgi:hypothetical protein
MDKLISYLIILILLFPSISSSTLGVSPDKLVFSGKTNEKICQDFSLFGNIGSIFHGEIKWSEIKSTDISNYVFSSEEKKVSSDFPKTTQAGSYQICVSSSEPKRIYGIFSYKLENSSYAIGMWIEVNITKGSLISPLPVTGKAVNDNSFKNIFLISPLLFLLILIFLLVKLKKKIKSSIYENI